MARRKSKLKPYTAEELGLHDPLFSAMMRAAERNNERRDQEILLSIQRRYEQGVYCNSCGSLRTSHKEGDFRVWPDKTQCSRALDLGILCDDLRRSDPCPPRG